MITERLIIIPISKEDSSFMYELMNSPKWLKYIGDRKVHTVEDAEKHIELKMRPQLERLGFQIIR